VATRSYLICTTPRSGSTLLCRYLAATGCAGAPQEYLLESALPGLFAKRGAVDFPSYFAALLAEEVTPNGVFGAKLMGVTNVFADALARLRELPGLGAGGLAPWELVASAFPDVRYVWLTRRDRQRQAISFYRALRTGIWQSTKAPKGPLPLPELDLAAVDDCLSDLVAWDAAWEEYFAGAGVRPATLVYEDLVREPGAAVRALLAALEIELPSGWSAGPAERQRLADEVSEQWLAEYRDRAKRARAGARRRGAAVEAREYVRLEGAPASEMAARVPAARLVKALLLRLTGARREPDAD
jgi:LPS sulfotransferase NodH